MLYYHVTITLFILLLLHITSYYCLFYYTPLYNNLFIYSSALPFHFSLLLFIFVYVSSFHNLTLCLNVSSMSICKISFSSVIFCILVAIVNIFSSVFKPYALNTGSSASLIKNANDIH